MSRTIVDSNIAPGQAFKNRIINGDMRIDQRNAGGYSSITNSSLLYTLDMWAGLGQATDGIFRIQRLSASPPTGFTNYLNVSINTADASVGSGQAYTVEHRIEGYNIADFIFGSASAKTVTLSFWVRSSVTGTYGIGVLNGAFNRCYTPTYTINSANVWEYKTIVIPGDVTGTWATDNSLGMRLIFDIGSGSTYEGTLNTWAAQSYFRTSACTRLISTLNATLDITGVQLEIGVAATPFEFHSIQNELILCQRYYEKNYDQATVPGATSVISGIIYSRAIAGTHIQTISFKVTKRAPPTVAVYNGVTGSSGSWRDYSASTNLTATANDISDSACWIGIASAVAGNGTGGYYVAKSEM